MSGKKVESGRMRVNVDPVKVELIYKTLPEYKKDRDLSRIIDDLMSDYLDNHPLIIMGCERERAFIDSLNKKNKEKTKTEISTSKIGSRKHKELQAEGHFQHFWETYRSAPKGVSNASKTKAKEEFKKAIVNRNAAPFTLIDAASKAVNDQKAQIAATGDCLCLPDAFRWLRDDMWESLIESVTVKQQVRTGIQIYD
tara:strand:+ start:697 stop:1287 length:591 start_codon:yes stop_codon:yes gene_type:complete